MPTDFLKSRGCSELVRGWQAGLSGTQALLVYLACACVVTVCLIVLFRDVLLFVHGQTDSSARFLKDIGDWRTIVWELGSLGRDHPSCYAALSFCLDVWQIKGLETVIEPRWTNDIIYLQCVSVRRTSVGIIAPVEAEILVIGLSDRVGGSMGRAEWLLLVSRWAWLWCRQISVRGAAVICPCAVRIGYKGRSLAGSSSFDAAPVTGSLLFYAPVVALPFVVPLEFLRGCFSAVLTVSGLLCSDCSSGESV